MNDKLKKDGQIRIVTVKALCDCDTVTHTLKKGTVTQMQSDHVATLLEQGKVELVTERAVTESAAKEKRG